LSDSDIKVLVTHGELQASIGDDPSTTPCFMAVVRAGVEKLETVYILDGEEGVGLLHPKLEDLLNLTL
jgi:hypothetical protein